MTVAQMDNFAYSYYPGTNKLRQVTDTRPATAFGSSGITAAYKDVDNQAADNYVYDAIGNLTKDNAEAISAITWNVYGKITGITKTGGNLTYTYDAQGNRITAFNSGTGKTTCYVRDAQGNVLATYEHAGTTLRLKEMHLYGSSRLGIHNFNMPLNTMSGEPTKIVGTVTGVRRNFTRGNKLFELSNHLGNILATIADQKTSLPNGIWVAKYQPLIVNTQDYYAFGMQAPFSEYNAGTGRYRYGFNGQEKSDEIKGSGNSYTAEFWEYDPRLGRRWNLDPKPTVGISQYSAFNNNPILFRDPNGDTTDYYNNNGKFIASDGIANGQKMIVHTDASASSIQKKYQDGTLSRWDQYLYSDISPNLTSMEINAIDRSYARTEANANEQGFAYGVLASGQPVVKDAPATDQTSIRTEYANREIKKLGGWDYYNGHTHPAFIKIDGVDIIGSIPMPSGNALKGDLASTHLRTTFPKMVMGYDIQNNFNLVLKSDISAARNANGAYIQLSNYTDFPKVITFYNNPSFEFPRGAMHSYKLNFLKKMSAQISLAPFK